MDLTLDKFLDILPTCVGSNRLPIIGGGPGFCYWARGLEEFVAPTVRTQEGDFQSCKVIILSAAGAVGKTTFARQIAFKCGAPYWDLAAEKSVGTRSLNGALAHSFGYSALSGLENHMQDGSLFFDCGRF